MAPYSMQTGKQQSIVRQLLRDLGVKYTTIYVRAGLQNISREIENRRFEISELQKAMANPRSRKKANVWRASQIKYIERSIKELKKYSRLKVTPFRGKLRFENLPEPERVHPDELKRRAERRKERAARKAEYQRQIVSGGGGSSQSYDSNREARASFHAVDGGASFSRRSVANLTVIRGGAQ